ncbi:MAG TPA: negative transcriptional regulator, partial [Sulfitobacter sp.]|nr:negative transcriptional regulator [Sulfitobacter sp.]
WKLGQNKDEAVRLAAADQMAAHGFGTDPAVMAALMRGV